MSCEGPSILKTLNGIHIHIVHGGPHENMTICLYVIFVHINMLRGLEGTSNKLLFSRTFKNYLNLEGGGGEKIPT